MTYEELAETLSLSMGTVKSRLARAHIAMERILRGKLDSFGFSPSREDAGPHEETRAAGAAGAAGAGGEGVA